MKKIIISFIFIFFSYFALTTNINAATFKEGAYLDNEYITKKKDGITYYLQMRYIKDEQNRIVYCLEPFQTFSNNKEYTEYENIYNYKNLNLEQIRKIELLIYYGYEYQNRTSSEWYAITQLLIWQVVDPSAPIYFTKTLNGQRLEKYSLEINQLWDDVNNHDLEPEFIHEYTVNYNDELIISEINNNYEIIKNDFVKEDASTFKINNVKKDGSIIIKKKSNNRYTNNFVIYDSYDSQDLILPGQIINKEMKIDIKVTKGDINLSIKKIDDVYSVESDFKNTCFLIYDEVSEYEKICTDKELNYKTNTLPYGEYKIKQISKGTGYHMDNKIYQVTIDRENEHPSVTIYNKLIKNTLYINKFYCKNDVCHEEPNANFAVYDSKNNLVKNIITDDKGKANILLGYGKYKVIQVKGLSGYKLANDFNIKIFDDKTKLVKDIQNDYIFSKMENDQIENLPNSEIEEIIPDDSDSTPEILPPKTGLAFSFNSIILISVLIIFKKVLL